MAELIRRWQEYDLFTKTEAELYADVAPTDLTDLRNSAARWAIGRVLRGAECRKIEDSLLVLSPGVNEVPQESPRIELRRAKSGLTLETYNLGAARFSVVSYYIGRLATQRVILEKITFDPRITPPIVNSSET